MKSTNSGHRVIVIGAGIGGLTTAALLAKDGYRVTVLESQVYPGGSAGTFYHKGYRFDAGATLAGGFQQDGPHDLIWRWLDIDWPVKPASRAWTVHLPEQDVTLSQDSTDLLRAFPQSENFWSEQQAVADLCWQMAATGIPWPPTSLTEFGQLIRVGLQYFPQNLRLRRYAFSTVLDWLQRHGLHRDKAFKRFIDAQLLISAQTIADNANAMYGATALDLARQGVMHVEGGIGSLAETLAEKIRVLGGEVLYRHRVSRISVHNGKATGVYARRGQRGAENFFAADMVIGNLTPWSTDALLKEYSPRKLRREIRRRQYGWGAFVLHVGLRADSIPDGVADHHQIIHDLDAPLGEGNSLFVSMSPMWDATRAPQGMRAVTITTHTEVQSWWDLLEKDEAAYHARKEEYAEQMIGRVDTILPGFKAGAELILPGSPVTYQFYTQRHMGMVGGFPQQSIFTARGPRAGIPNVRIVGDSIFPGQSTAGVTLGAIRVANDVRRALGQVKTRSYRPVQETATELS